MWERETKREREREREREAFCLNVWAHDWTPGSGFVWSPKPDIVGPKCCLDVCESNGYCLSEHGVDRCECLPKLHDPDLSWVHFPSGQPCSTCVCGSQVSGAGAGPGYKAYSQCIATQHKASGKRCPLFLLLVNEAIGRKLRPFWLRWVVRKMSWIRAPMSMAFKGPGGPSVCQGSGTVIGHLDMEPLETITGQCSGTLKNRSSSGVDRTEQPKLQFWKRIRTQSNMSEHQWQCRVHEGSRKLGWSVWIMRCE